MPSAILFIKILLVYQISIFFFSTFWSSYNFRSAQLLLDIQRSLPVFATDPTHSSMSARPTHLSCMGVCFLLSDAAMLIIGVFLTYSTVPSQLICPVKLASVTG